MLKDYVASITAPVETASWDNLLDQFQHFLNLTDNKMCFFFFFIYIYILSYCLLLLKYISEEDSAFYSITLDKMWELC